MAAYSVTSFVTPVGPMDTVVAALETKLETLDSTTNSPLYIYDVYQVAGDNFKGVIVYKS